MGNNSNTPKKDHSVLLEAELNYLIENTNFDKLDIEKWHKIFITDSPSGLVNEEKLCKLMKELKPNGKNIEEFTEKIFPIFDADGSGKIDFVEFIMSFCAFTGRNPEKQLEFVFKCLIDRKELEKMFKIIFKFHGKKKSELIEFLKEKVDRIFETLDKDGNGCIDKDEFIKGCLDDSDIMQALIP